MNCQCPCEHCNGLLEFESQYAGEIADCPHCGKEATLFIRPKAPVRAVFAPAPTLEPVSVAYSKPATRDYTGDSAVLLFCSVLLPFIGFLGDIWLMAKGQHGRGIVCIGLSIICGFVWYAIFTS